MTHLYARSAGLVLALLLLAGTAAAQTRTVSGTVTDAATGESLPGVNVLVQATNIGTTTGLDGRYELALPDGQRTLLFSYVGYRNETVEVPPDATTISVALDEDILGLDEAVVTGLATSVQRANLANSVETISARELAEVTTNQTLDGAINGKVTGAVITSYTGAPGGGISVKLRGITTINGRSQPLYIVDGVIISNDAVSNGVNAVTAAAAGGNASSQDNPANRIADLSPEDIESIEILKGPSAAAIYGARASNGVVIITTKKGRAGQGVQLSFQQSLGFTTLANPIGSRQFTEESAIAQFGPSPLDDDATPEEIAEFEAGVEAIRQLYRQGQAAGFYDYEQELYGNEGLLSTTQISAAGGNDRTTFFISGLVKDDEGIVERTGYEKQSARVNVTHRFSSRASLDVTSNYVRSEARRGLTGNDNSGTTFGVSLTATPNFVDLFPDGNGIYPAHPFNASNPLQTRDLADIGEETQRFLGSGRFTLNLLQQDNQALQAVAEGGVDYYGLAQSSVFPVELVFYEGQDLIGQSIQGRTNNLNTNFRGSLVHSLGLPESDLFFTTQAGVTAFDQDFDRTTAAAAGIIPGQENVDQATSLQTDQFRLFQRDRAFFGQEEINWGNRIIVTGGVRAERSSLNGDVGKYYAYPKASVAFNVTNFDFWNVSAVDLLKFRVAFGQTGNTAPFGSKYTTFGPIAIGGNIGSHINPQRGEPAIEPERATEIEGGVDVSILDGTANLEFTVYRKVIDDLVLTRQLEPSSGFATETINAGQLTNNGIEVGLSVIPINMPDFQWVSRTSFWANRAEVTELAVPAFQTIGGGFGNTLGSIRIEEGEAPTQIVGIDDTDGDGVSDGVFQLGDVAPDFQMSFFNDFTLWDNLRLTVFGHWKKGGDVINLTELLADLNGTSVDFDQNAGTRLAALGVSAAPFVQDASYFKLREVGLYYTLPAELLGPGLGSAVRNIRIGASANNVFTITPYKSYDPEVHNFGDSPVATGVEVTPFPTSRSFLFHLGFGL
ncbi:MAG: SusC/RagA family TonB-linked outer membrane protein [Rubricoccaceae bacterium]|nr:SusC/RagA family TonB-linked outer membrane protein [Rubricoccaceae bacterium]